MRQLSAETRVKITKMAATKMRTHREIGDIFNVPTRVVSYLSSTTKRGKSVIAKRRGRELARSQTQAVLIAVVGQMIEDRQSIWNVKQIQGLVKEKHDLAVPANLVLAVLKKQFRLSYRKIKRVPYSGNTERSKALRSLYAQKMLAVYQSG